ncbi:MAG: hypothetical protein HY619_00645, partial [Thaumarchaeota archaeon]|nr:hypothetical protein [Nitrososphaerota archaeon]
RVEEQRLKENLCGKIVGIINFVGASIPLSVKLLQNKDNQIEGATIGTDGVISLIMSDGERTFMKINDLDSQGVLRLVQDMLPKFKGVIESDLKILNERADLMNKAVARLEKAQPVLRKSGEGALVDIVDEDPNV